MTWAGLGFAIGSVLFMLGVPMSTASWLAPAVSAWTYFAGSLFFTTAATVQSLDAMRPPGEAARHHREWTSSDRANLLAALVQWIGTVAFNVTTLRAALDAGGRADYTAQVVWSPDAFGSVLFLVSSAVALVPEVHRRRHRHVRDRAWVIAAVNMLGSVLFGVSAVAAWTNPSTDELISLTWSNAGTFLGALCFLVGAFLMLPRHEPVVSRR